MIWAYSHAPMPISYMGVSVQLLIDFFILRRCSHTHHIIFVINAASRQGIQYYQYYCKIEACNRHTLSHSEPYICSDDLLLAKCLQNLRHNTLLKNSDWHMYCLVILQSIINSSLGRFKVDKAIFYSLHYFIINA